MSASKKTPPTFAVRSTARTAAPHLPYQALKERALGAAYELSLVFVGDTLSQALNKKHRGKTYRPNVLSFPNTKTSGEIFINLMQATREARRFDVSVRARVALLYVHALYHLKGYDHGDAMERSEQSLLRAFNLAD